MPKATSTEDTVSSAESTPRQASRCAIAAALHRDAAELEKVRAWVCGESLAPLDDHAVRALANAAELLSESAKRALERAAMRSGVIEERVIPLPPGCTSMTVGSVDGIPLYVRATVPTSADGKCDA